MGFSPNVLNGDPIGELDGVSLSELKGVFIDELKLGNFKEVLYDLKTNLKNGCHRKIEHGRCGFLYIWTRFFAFKSIPSEKSHTKYVHTHVC